jgi:hypothetical protein
MEKKSGGVMFLKMNGVMVMMEINDRRRWALEAD